MNSSHEALWGTSRRVKFKFRCPLSTCTLLLLLLHCNSSSSLLQSSFRPPQLATKALTSTSEEELGNRVKALTENLIQKQTLIEALSTEKNSLVLQLERLEVWPPCTYHSPIYTSEYMKFHIFELRRKIRRYDWSSAQFCTQLRQLWN